MRTIGPKTGARKRAIQAEAHSVTRWRVLDGKWTKRWSVQLPQSNTCAQPIGEIRYCWRILGLIVGASILFPTECCGPRTVGEAKRVSGPP